MTDDPQARPDTTQSLAHLRDLDRDSYLAVLLTPAEARMAGAAALGLLNELLRIPATVREPAAARLRLAWWTDALARTPGSHSGGAPTTGVAAQPVLRLLASFAVQSPDQERKFQTMLAATDFATGGEPPRDMAALTGFADATWGEAMRLIHDLAGAPSPGGAFARMAQGVGLSRLLLDLPRWAGHGRLFLPADRLAHHGVAPASAAGSAGLGKVVQEVAQEARRLLAGPAHPDRVGGGAAARPITLLAGVARRDLGRLQRADHDPWRVASDPWPVWRRAGMVWRGLSRRS
ncbi:MAG: squalene/phytoene synthase family protein [Alphaproteobacteria bacterium]